MLRIAIAWEEALPAVDTTRVTLEGLRSALAGLELMVLGADDLARLPMADLLVLPFGSAFPKDGWPEIATFLESGGNLLNLGGVPFAVPCRRDHVVWRPEMRQSAYHLELGIRQAHPIPAGAIDSLVVPEDQPLLAGLAEPVRGRGAYAFTLAAGVEDGSGPWLTRGREPLVRALLYGVNTSGERVVAPITAIDHQDGPFAGGRWVLASVDGEFPSEAIRRLVLFAAQGASDLAVTPAFACYRDGEQAELMVHAGRFGTMRGRHSVQIAITDPVGVRCSCEAVDLTPGHGPAYRWTRCAACPQRQTPSAPGLHVIEAALVDDDARKLAAALGIPASARIGEDVRHSAFWVWDEQLATSGAQVTLDGDGFRRDGEPAPLLGVTYTGTEHASPLVAPDAYRWDRDFAAMKQAGVSLLRTGLWRSWSDAVKSGGVPDQALLRAMDALLLTARRHDLVVLLGLFDPTLGEYDGGNPYLHPEMAAAQQEFVAALMERYAQVPGVMWNLADSPAPRDPDHAHTLRPAGGPQDDAAWFRWISGRSQDELREAWRLTPRETVSIPSQDPGPDTKGLTGLRSLDYRLFAEDTAARWAMDLQTLMRLHGGRDPLVTVGDAALPGAPSEARLMAEMLDFTVRPVAPSRDFLWRVLLAAPPCEPGVLGAIPGGATRDPDGRWGTSEENSRNLLERAVAFAFGVGCAGAIPWPWQVSPAGGAEAGAGFLRADGSSHPAVSSVAALSAFLSRNRGRFEGREPEAAAVVIPVARMHYQYSLGARGLEACVNAFHEVGGLPLRAASSYRPEELRDARLILIPSPRVLRQEAWDACLEHVDAGATMLVTGPIEHDEYWRPCERLAALGLSAHVRRVARYESVHLNGQALALHYGAHRAGQVDKAVFNEGDQDVRVVPHGQGKVIYCPQPIELADESGSLALLYDFAVAASGIERLYALQDPQPGLLVRGQPFRDAVLYTLISEVDEERAATLLHGPARVPIPITVPALRAVLLFVDRATGRVLDEYKPPA